MLTNRNDIIAQLTAGAEPECVALLLAGGDGTRLQDLTREIEGAAIPKQYCRLWHGSSLLESTLSRAHLFAPRTRIHIIVNKNHLHYAKKQLSGLPDANILVQPQNQDTGPGILFALLHLQTRFPNATVAVFPTDHFVNDDRTFIAHVIEAAATIAQMPDKIAILGVVPDRPEPGYGYILPSCSLDSSGKAYQVEAFIEKPSIDDAQAIISRGGLWNTFVMVFRIPRMLNLVRALVPHHFEKISQLGKSPAKAAKLYRTLKPWNFSTEVLSMIPEHLIMQQVSNVQWSDWGTRESVERTYRSLNMIPFWNVTSRVPHPLTQT